MGFGRVLLIVASLGASSTAFALCPQGPYSEIERVFERAGFEVLEERVPGDLPLFGVDQVFLSPDLSRKAYLKFVPVREKGSARADVVFGSEGEFLVAGAGQNVEAVVLFSGLRVEEVQKLAEDLLHSRKTRSTSALEVPSWLIGTAEASTESECTTRPQGAGTPNIAQIELALEYALKSQQIAGASAAVIRAFWSCLKGVLRGVGSSVVSTVRSPADMANLFAELGRIRFAAAQKEEPITSTHGIVEALKWPFRLVAGRGIHLQFLEENSQALSAVLQLGNELFKEFASFPPEQQLGKVCSAVGWIGAEALQLYLLGKLPLGELARGERFRQSVRAVKGATDEKIAGRLRGLGLNTDHAFLIRKLTGSDPVLTDRLLELMAGASPEARRRALAQLRRLSEGDAAKLRTRLKGYVGQCSL